MLKIKEKFHVEEKKKTTQQFTFKAGAFYNRKQRRQMNKHRHNYYTKKYASTRARKYAFDLL